MLFCDGRVMMMLVVIGWLLCIRINRCCGPWNYDKRLALEIRIPLKNSYSPRFVFLNGKMISQTPFFQVAEEEVFEWIKETEPMVTPRIIMLPVDGSGKLLRNQRKRDQDGLFHWMWSKNLSTHSIPPYNSALPSLADSQRALDWTLDNLRLGSDQVVLVHVRENPSAFAFGNPYLDYGSKVIAFCLIFSLSNNLLSFSDIIATAEEMVRSIHSINFSFSTPTLSHSLFIPHLTCLSNF